IALRTVCTASPRFAPKPIYAVTASRIASAWIGACEQALILRLRRLGCWPGATFARGFAAATTTLLRRARAALLACFAGLAFLRRLGRASSIQRHFRRPVGRAWRAHTPLAFVLLLAQLRDQVFAHGVAGLAELLPPVGQHHVDLAGVGA